MADHIVMSAREDQSGGFGILNLGTSLKIVLKIAAPPNIPVDDIIDLAMAMSYTIKFIIQLKLMMSGEKTRKLKKQV